MALDLRELDGRVQKLRKSLKGFPKNPSPDDVHDLRTRTRRVQSILESLDLTSSGNEQKLLAGLEAIRKRAGKVRDMDVLTADVIGLTLKDDANCLVRLTHHLGVQRHRQERKLHAKVHRRASELRGRLKRSRRKLDRAVDHFTETKYDLDRNRDPAEDAPLHAMSEVLRLSTELAGVHRLGRDNLHAYRLEVKHLRYILEMSAGDIPQQRDFIKELKQVQDLIGDWHDWVELTAIAREVLRSHRGCKLVKKVKRRTEQKFVAALQATEQMRRRYLFPRTATAKSSHRRKQRQPPGPVLIAASQIAA